MMITYIHSRKYSLEVQKVGCGTDFLVPSTDSST